MVTSLCLEPISCWKIGRACSSMSHVIVLMTTRSQCLCADCQRATSLVLTCVTRLRVYVRTFYAYMHKCTSQYYDTSYMIHIMQIHAWHDPATPFVCLARRSLRMIILTIQLMLSRVSFDYMDSDIGCHWDVCPIDIGSFTLSTRLCSPYSGYHPTSPS